MIVATGQLSKGVLYKYSIASHIAVIKEMVEDKEGFKKRSTSKTHASGKDQIFISALKTLSIKIK